LIFSFIVAPGIGLGARCTVASMRFDVPQSYNNSPKPAGCKVAEPIGHIHGFLLRELMLFNIWAIVVYEVDGIEAIGIYVYELYLPAPLLILVKTK